MKNSTLASDAIPDGIPQDWKVAHVGDLVSCRKGRKPVEILHASQERTLPYLTVDVVRTGEIRQWAIDDGNATRVSQENIFLIWDGFHSGEVFTGFSGILSSTFAKIKLESTSIDGRFLYYFLKTRFKTLNSQTAGMYLKHVSRTVFESLLVPFPLLPEQRKIASILSTVDGSIQKTDEIIKATQRLKQGLMQQLLTRGIGHASFKQTEVGQIPQGWNVISLDSLLKLGSGLPRPKGMSKTKIEFQPFPVYGGNGVMGYADEYTVAYRTVVIGRVGEYCGNVYDTLGPAWVTDNALYVKRFLMEVDAAFLALALERLELNRLGLRSGQPLINQKIVYRMKMGLPPMNEQRRIAAIIESVDRKLAIEVGGKETLNLLRTALMQALLTGKVRVRVD